MWDAFEAELLADFLGALVEEVEEQLEAREEDM
jgi:hypothetical protein